MPDQAAHSPSELGVLADRLGPLPLINHFLRCIGLAELLERHVPTADGHGSIPHAQAQGVLLRSIIVEREPVYRQQECTTGFAAGLVGIDAAQAARLTDDRIGRSLDRRFACDRAALLTEVVLAARRFGLVLRQLHNDSTSVSLCGKCPAARGRSLGARRAPAFHLRLLQGPSPRTEAVAVHPDGERRRRRAGASSMRRPPAGPQAPLGRRARTAAWGRADRPGSGANSGAP
jgi:hypothetical protein